MMGIFVDITGQRFGRLTVVERAGKRGTGVLWRCQCECGGYATTTTGSLRIGNTTSCGVCVRFTHAKSKGKTYKIWVAMHQRCNNPNNESYSGYGERGISVCERWMSFNNFLADMGEKPDGLSLDRIENSEGYSTSNCRWATPKEQAYNRRTTRMIEFHGAKYCLTDLARMHGLSPDCLSYRIKKGMDLEAALNKPKYRRTA